MNVTSSFEAPALRPIQVFNFQSVIGHIPILRALEWEHFLSVPFFVLVFLVSYISWLSAASSPVVKGPVAGYRNYLDPTFLLRIRFIFSAVSIMQSGYHKFKDSCYVVRRMDTDLTILNTKYLDELRNIDLEELNSTHANIHNVLGDYTNLKEMRKNHNFIKVISHYLNPNINEFMEYIQDELDYSFEVDMPKFEGDEWKPVYIHSLLRRVISRVASRVLLGLPYCRDETMVSITETHTISIFGVIFILRRVPPFFHPLVAPLIPYRWMIWWNIRRAKKITQRVIEGLEAEKKANASGSKGNEKDGKKEKTLIEWIIDNAEPQYSNLDSLVGTQLAVSTAAVYTSSQVTSHMLSFLAQNPQYIAELREEIARSTDASGWIDVSKLRKLEACVQETLRMSPPQTNAPQRRALQDVTLKDGVVIPKGALIGFPCVPAGMDPSIYPSPEKYLPFDRPENFATPVTTPTRSQLAFGWGSQACPGRFFAAKEIKVLAARMLMEYDFETVPGAGRYYDIEDFRILNPMYKLRIRPRNSRA